MIARDGTEVWVRDEAFAMADDTRSGRRASRRACSSRSPIASASSRS